MQMAILDWLIFMPKRITDRQCTGVPLVGESEARSATESPRTRDWPPPAKADFSVARIARVIAQRIRRLGPRTETSAPRPERFAYALLLRTVRPRAAAFLMIASMSAVISVIDMEPLL
jgi:hypothetical protein